MININDYKIRVYIDEIEGWQDIEVSNIKILNDYRAVVVTKNETKVNRVYKQVNSIEECKPDRCIYLIKKPI